jgi:hypothetical protein
MINNTVLFVSIFNLFFFVLQSVSQDYRIINKELTEKSKKGSYEFSVSYPLISDYNTNITSMNLFNKLIENKMEALRDTFRVWMKDWEVPNEMTGVGSYYEAGDSVYFADNRLISIQFFEGYYFAGAAHPNNSSFTINYDLVNNSEITIDNLLTAGWEKKISEICIKSLKEQKNILPENEDDWIKRGAGPEKKNFEVFNITKNGLLITFITYQVGSYAEGPSEVNIPYLELKDIINNSSMLKDFFR